MEHDETVPERWIALLDAIDHNTETQKNMVDGLAKICEAIAELTDVLEKK